MSTDEIVPQVQMPEGKTLTASYTVVREASNQEVRVIVDELRLSRTATVPSTLSSPCDQTVLLKGVAASV